ncbi:hypothetical protein BN1723_011125, partial [Verticillium longisporum]
MVNNIQKTPAAPPTIQKSATILVLLRYSIHPSLNNHHYSITHPRHTELTMPVITHTKNISGVGFTGSNVWNGSAEEIADRVRFVYPRVAVEVSSSTVPASEEKRASCSGWNCLNGAQQLGIVISCIVIGLTLLLALTYYKASRKEAGWARNSDNIAMRRTRCRQQPSPEDGRRASIVSRYTDNALPTLPGVRPPTAEPPVFFPLIMSYPTPTGPIYQAPPLLFHPHKEEISRPSTIYQPNIQPVVVPGTEQPPEDRAGPEKNKERTTKKNKRQSYQHHQTNGQQYPGGLYPRAPTIGQKFMRLFGMQTGRAETIASSRQESQERVNPAQVRQSNNDVQPSTMHVEEHSNKTAYPIRVPVEPLSPDSNAATVYSDDYVLPTPHGPIRTGSGAASIPSPGHRRHSSRRSVSRGSGHGEQPSTQVSISRDSRDGDGAELTDGGAHSPRRARSQLERTKTNRSRDHRQGRQADDRAGTILSLILGAVGIHLPTDRRSGEWKTQVKERKSQVLPDELRRDKRRDREKPRRTHERSLARPPMWHLTLLLLCLSIKGVVVMKRDGLVDKFHCKSECIQP